MTGRKRGRPRKAASAKTAVFSTRITPELRQNLERAAEEQGVTLTDEIEGRLNRSFQLDARIGRLYEAFGGEQNYAVLRIVAELMKKLAAATGKSWADDPWTCEQLQQGIAYLLSQWRPAGEPQMPTLQRFSPEEAARLGATLARHELIRLDFTEGSEGDVLTQIKTSLGSLVDRGGYAHE